MIQALRFSGADAVWLTYNQNLPKFNIQGFFHYANPKSQQSAPLQDKELYTYFGADRQDHSFHSTGCVCCTEPVGPGSPNQDPLDFQTFGDKTRALILRVLTNGAPQNHPVLTGGSLTPLLRLRLFPSFATKPWYAPAL